jgi:DNA-binding SARP family transcriptional activator
VTGTEARPTTATTGPVEPVTGPGVEVVVLGPVAVRGADRPLRRARTLDLVVYLAMHPGGVGNDAWATALWPDRAMSAPTLHSTSSAARRALGRDAAGRDHLPRHRGGLRLAPSVVSDWARLAASARSDRLECWTAGLSLVRGRPFDGLGSPDWVVLEGLGAEVEDTVVRLALRTGDRQLAAGDAAGAAWSARKGLLACPFDERLYRLLMRAADAEGHPAGVESAMAELQVVLGGSRDPDSGPDSGVHAETAALYRALSRRSGAAAERSAARR